MNVGSHERMVDEWKVGSFTFAVPARDREYSADCRVEGRLFALTAVDIPLPSFDHQVR
jgi:hypothetical protein